MLTKKTICTNPFMRSFFLSLLSLLLSLSFWPTRIVVHRNLVFAFASVDR